MQIFRTLNSHVYKEPEIHKTAHDESYEPLYEPVGGMEDLE